MTLSLNGAFGSAVVAKGTGFLLNNHLLDFDTRDVLGNPSNGQTGPKNGPEPGKRPLSAMSPTIVVRDGKALLVTGAAGGPTILRGVPQAIVDTIDFGMNVAEAIDAERIFPANVAAAPTVPPDGAVDVLDMEGSRIDETVKTELKRRGHRLANEADEYSNLPVLQGVGTDLATGEHTAYSDTRGPEHAAAVEP
jgi:gamma-glutamyltranspeptidase/glutathione hydrolase